MASSITNTLNGNPNARRPASKGFSCSPKILIAKLKDQLKIIFFCFPRSLDNLLCGGLIFGHLIDVCGLSASGKTQLHTTIAVNWSINYNYETFVIDTKGDISGERIHSMLAHRRQKFSPEQCKQIMRNIRVAKCNDSLLQLIECIEQLLQSMHLHRKFKLLVIDSLPALWFFHHGSKSTHHYRQLATLADLLRKLAVEHGIVVLAVNIQTRLIVSNGKGSVHRLEKKNESINWD